MREMTMSGSTKTIAAVLILTIIASVCMQRVNGIRFVVHREECVSHNVNYEADTIQISYVVIKPPASPWHYYSVDDDDHGVDLLIKGPSGEQIDSFEDKISDKYEFIAQHKGLHRFCFSNKTPYRHVTIDFDLHVAHRFLHDYQPAKDEHFNPLLENIAKLEDALDEIQFEQRWLEAQVNRQALVNKEMSSRAIYKAMFEATALIGASLLQVHLLKRLFERKLTICRV